MRLGTGPSSRRMNRRRSVFRLARWQRQLLSRTYKFELNDEPHEQRQTHFRRSHQTEHGRLASAFFGGGIPHLCGFQRPGWRECDYADENVWLSQKMMGVLYDVETHTINYHLKKVFEDSELEEDSVIRNFRITAADGKTYDTGTTTSRPSSPSATR
jgi:hypothetical protein